MLARRRQRFYVLAAALGFAGVALAAGDDEPDIAFIEYLGLWEASDEEWLMFERQEEHQLADSGKRIDPVPKGEEPAENDDED